MFPAVGSLFYFFWILCGISAPAFIPVDKMKVPVLVKYLAVIASIPCGPVVPLAVLICKAVMKQVNSRKAEEQNRAEQRINDIELINSGGQVSADIVSAEEKKAVFTIKKLILQGLEQGASDIFFDPQPDGSCSVRMRVNGVLGKVCDIEASSAGYLVYMLKTVGNMNVSERKQPQNGAFSAGIEGNICKFRVASVGVYSGEKISIHTAGPSSVPQKMSDLGLAANEYNIISQVICQNSGMVLICGPAGSGKSTTGSVMLKSIDCSARNVVSIEKRITAPVPEITQMEVNFSNGSSYASLLRSALPQTPDIILIDDLPDKETAGIAIQSAQTGCVVIACLESSSCSGAVGRLYDAGVPFNSIAAALRAVISQRLIRTLCPHCRRRVDLPAELADYFAQTGLAADNICVPTGCPQCDGTGYAGHRAVFDVMFPDQQLMELFANGDPAAVREYIDTLHGSSMMAYRIYQLASQGICSIDEVNRIIHNVG